MQLNDETQWRKKNTEEKHKLKIMVALTEHKKLEEVEESSRGWREKT